MADAVEKTGKTIQAALEAALAELGAGPDDVTYEVLARPTKGLFGLLGAKPAKIRVTLKENLLAPTVEAPAPTVSPPPAPPEAAPAPPPVEAEADVDARGQALARGKDFLAELFAAMQVPATIEAESTEDGYVCHLLGEDLGVLIGKHGQTLDALQYLANIVANRHLTGDRVRLILDVEDYRRRREETLRRLAERLAEKACRLREEVRLEPMNRHERKIIHLALQGNRRVTTYSDGDEPHRCVVIAPRRGRRE